MIYFKTLFLRALDIVFKQKSPSVAKCTHLGKSMLALVSEEENNWLEQIHSERFPEYWFVVLVEAGKNGDNGWITAKGEVAVGRGWVLITGEVRGV